jgi:hypothetical protein
MTEVDIFVSVPRIALLRRVKVSIRTYEMHV